MIKTISNAIAKQESASAKPRLIMLRKKRRDGTTTSKRFIRSKIRSIRVALVALKRDIFLEAFRAATLAVKLTGS